MRHHAHLTLSEREDIMIMRREGRKITEIAEAIGRSKSTVSRELRRNSCQRFYRASTARASWTTMICSAWSEISSWASNGRPSRSRAGSRWSWAPAP